MNNDEFLNQMNCVMLMSGRRFATLCGRKMTVKRKVGKRTVRSQFVVRKVPFNRDDQVDSVGSSILETLNGVNNGIN